MRWKKLVGGLALGLATIAGCKQQCFLTEHDLKHAQTLAGSPKDLDANPAYSSLTPALGGKIGHAPSTIHNPEREVRFLSLAEAFAMALENGTVGQGLNGQVDDSLNPQVGDLGGPLDRQSIRVLALEPALFQTNIEAAQSRFDARLISNLSWQNTDRPIGTAIDFFQTAGRSRGAIETTDANFRTALIKPLPTGGVAGITFNTDYQLTNITSAPVNPSYRPSVQFQFEQPLLRGYGVELNQIAASHPGSIQQGGPITRGTQFTNSESQNVNGGILITRIRYDQSRAVLEAQVNQMLLNVEVAYWNLYGAYGELYAREIALRQNLGVWRITELRVKAGKEKNTPAELYQSEGQYHQSRSDFIRAQGQLLERERSLRGLLGLPVDDGTRLVPSDAPMLAPYQPDWESSVAEALTLRPELVLARDNLKAQSLSLIEVKNRLLPDLRFTSTYDSNTIGGRLDGAGTFGENAFRNLASNRNNNWSLGLRFEMPLGFRDAHAGLRQARMRLAQHYWALRTMEDKTQRFLTLQYRNVAEFQRQIEVNRASVDAYNNQLNVRLEVARSGQQLAVDVTLEAIRFGTQALQLYYTNLAQYNASLATFEYAKGTLLKRNNIVICEGALPGCAQVRAVEHERERSKALVLRERSLPLLESGPPVGSPAPSLDKLEVPRAYEKVAVPEMLRGPSTPSSSPTESIPTPQPMKPHSPTTTSPTPVWSATPPATAIPVPKPAASNVTTGTISFEDEPASPAPGAVVLPPVRPGRPQTPGAPGPLPALPTPSGTPGALPPLPKP